MLSFGVIIYFMLSFNVIIFWCYHLMLSFGVIIWCYHLFYVIIWCYHFSQSGNVIIFPCTGWVLSFMLSFNVIIFCYHFPPFFLFPENVTHSVQVHILFFCTMKSEACCIPSPYLHCSLSRLPILFIALEFKLAAYFCCFSLTDPA